MVIGEVAFNNTDFVIESTTISPYDNTMVYAILVFYTNSIETGHVNCSILVWLTSQSVVEIKKSVSFCVIVAFNVIATSDVMFLLLWNWIVANTNLLSFIMFTIGKDTLAKVYNIAPLIPFINYRLVAHVVAVK